MSNDDKLLEIILENHNSLSSKIDNLTERMEQRFDKIESVQIGQAADIKHHIARTDILQEMVEPLHKEALRKEGVKRLLKIIGKITGTLLGSSVLVFILQYFLTH